MPTADQLLGAITLASALGCGLVAGIFFAFSTFVMKALSGLPPRDGLAAMQSINVAVLNPWFLGAFLGTAAVCLMAMLYSVLRWQEAHAPYLLVGGALYLAGCLLVTAAANVPENEALATVEPGDPEAELRWRRYVATWTAWNHVRTAAALAGAAAFSIALGRGALG